MDTLNKSITDIHFEVRPTCNILVHFNLQRGGNLYKGHKWMVPNVSIIQRFHCIPYVINMCLLLVNIHAVVKTSRQDTHCPHTTALPGPVDISPPVPPGPQTTAVPGSVDTSPPVPPGPQTTAVPRSVDTSSPVPPGPQTTAVPGSVNPLSPVPPCSQQNAGVSSSTIQPGIAHLVH